MARIRTIKPEFPQSESIGKISRDARLLFVQLWTVADDYGRARAANRLLAGQLYPYDDDAPSLIGAWLDELQAAGHIRLYELEGSRYLEILGWAKHQRVDNAGKSTIPAHDGDSPQVSAIDGESPLYLGPRKGPRKGPRTNIRTVANATRPARDELFEDFKRAYPRRKGGNPWKTARDVWDAALKAGTSADQIISAVKAGIGFDPDKAGTEFIPQAVKWLRDRRYQDYTPPSSSGADCSSSRFYAEPESDELDAWDAHARATGGSSLPRDRNGGWYVAARWPPGYVPAETRETAQAH